MNPVKPSPLDWLSFPPTSPGDVHAPHPDLFDLELEASIITLPQSDQEQLQLLNIELSDPYAFLRSETPRCGPPSAFTVSSESTYGGDSYSTHSESLYNYSELDGTNNTDYNVDLGIDFSKFSVDVDAAAAEATEQLEAAAAAVVAAAAATRIKEENDNSQTAVLLNLEDDTSMSSERNNANNNNIFTIPFSSSIDIAFGDASTAAQSVATDYYPSAVYNRDPRAAAQAGISPANLLPLVVSPVLSSMEHASVSPTPSSSNGSATAAAAAAAAAAEEQRDPRKKYKCPSCPRAFARAYNLKTHQQTHDPNRLKPHTCPHKACGRSFSRKHDLGRHLVSIHRDEHAPGNVDVKLIGVNQGPRGWCKDCGAGWVGKQGGCACRDVK